MSTQVSSGKVGDFLPVPSIVITGRQRSERDQMAKHIMNTLQRNGHRTVEAPDFVFQIQRHMTLLNPEDPDDMAMFQRLAVGTITDQIGTYRQMAMHVSRKHAASQKPGKTLLLFRSGVPDLASFMTEEQYNEMHRSFGYLPGHFYSPFNMVLRLTPPVEFLPTEEQQADFDPWAQHPNVVDVGCRCTIKERNKSVTETVAKFLGVELDH
jgi:hypothetical protein